MTTEEAYYVLDHWREYDDRTVAYAREVVETAERQGYKRRG